tara:strand:+ start:1020 stop:1340 length:321 start_codon:yes stop_codon:yes gene_type:complete
MSSEYERGFIAGWRSRTEDLYGTDPSLQPDPDSRGFLKTRATLAQFGAKPKRKKPQTGKAKLLTTMTKKKWDKYKKGNGKKTYVEIRALVSKSQDYKRACKRKGFK